MMVVKRDVIKSKRIHRLARVFISKQRRIALDIGVQPLFRQQVRCDALDLLRRAAVQRRQSDRRTDMRRNRFDKRGVNARQARKIVKRPGFTLCPHRRRGRVLQPFDERVDLRGFYPLQIVPDAHVKDEAAFVSQTERAGNQLERKPRLDIFSVCLRYAQLGRPFDIVAFILRVDARLGDRQILAVELLHGF